MLKSADFMVFPSLGDGFGLSVTEALASGCPVICSENAGVSDLIEDGYNGFVIPAQNVDAIIKNVIYFFQNREHLKQMQINARQTAIKYTWENYYKNIGDIFEQILSDENVKVNEFVKK